MAKTVIRGIVQNVSTYPLPTLRPKKANTRSATLTFDIHFDLFPEDGPSKLVWFYRGFRFPPPLDDGDYVEVQGRFGQALGLLSRGTFFASRIIDTKRGRIYTSLRNKRIKDQAPPQVGSALSS